MKITKNQLVEMIKESLHKKLNEQSKEREEPSCKLCGSQLPDKRSQYCSVNCEKNAFEKKEPVKEEKISHEDDYVDELLLFIQNDGDLYRRMYKPIMKNLARKMKRDLYNPNLAIKLWYHLATEGAKKYVKDIKNLAYDEYYDMFPKETRLKVAKELSHAFEDKIKSGELDVDDLADYVSTIKKCPTCNQRPEIKKGDYWGWTVKCYNCYDGAEDSSNKNLHADAKTRKDAVGDWNERVELYK